MKIGKITEKTREFVSRQIAESWGSVMVVSRGVLHDTRLLNGFVVMENDMLAGYALYNIEGGECELVVLESVVQNHGLGAALISEVKRVATEANCRRVWLITTNDNTHAIRFYQKRGLELAGVRLNVMDEARLLKPQIPPTGDDGIPIKHEFEFEILL